LEIDNIVDRIRSSNLQQVDIVNNLKLQYQEMINLNKKKTNLKQLRDKFVPESLSEYAVEISSTLQSDKKNIDSIFEGLKEEIKNNNASKMADK